MRITADTNVLLRSVLDDDADQAAVARRLLERVAVVAIPIPVFCEFVWVLKCGYGYGNDDIAAAVRAICDVDTVATDHPAVEAGLAALKTGGDFADGVIAHQGASLGGAVFASFERHAVADVRAGGGAAADPSALLEDRLDQ